RLLDRLLEIELVRRALAAEATQPAQGDVDLPDVEDAVAAVLAKAALGGHLHRRAAAAGTDADPGGVMAAGAERRGAAGADPAVAAVVTLSLLGESLLEEPAQLGEIERLDQPA